MNVEDILNERENTHGDFRETARIAQALKRVIIHARQGRQLDAAAAEALDMIATKIARILSGNASEPDHWVDLSGYSMLIARRLLAEGASFVRTPASNAVALNMDDA